MPWRRVGGTKAAVKQRWPQCLKSVSDAHFVSVLCAVLCPHAITIVTENRLRSIFIDNFL